MTVVTVQAQTPPPDILLVDGEHAMHRALHAYAELRTSAGLMSGAFYGFLSIIVRQVEALQPRSVIVVWGHPKSGSKRKADFGEYKAGRHHDPILYKQMADIQAFLAVMGWSQYFNDEGWEADDVIATLVHEFEKEYSIVILSGDHDFLQLVNEKVHCLKPGNSKNPDVRFDIAAVKEKFNGVGPEDLADLYAITGEKSDNIEGVPGIGAVTAAKILVNNGPIRTWFNNIDGIYASPRHKQLLKEHKDKLVRNKKLVSLKTTRVALCEIEPTYDTEAASLVLDKYEIKKFSCADFQIANNATN